MTREEAIDSVRTAFEMWESGWDCGEDWSEEHIARDMAIEALKAKDVIEAFDRTVEAIKGQEWIPCGKRLPNDPGQVLVTVLWHEPYDNLEVTLGEYWSEPEGWGDWKGGEVIAWMPLPRPYQQVKKRPKNLL